MKIELQDGCVGMGVYIDGRPWFEALQIHDTKNRIEIYVLKHLWDNDPFDWMRVMLPEADVEDLGECEQCGDHPYLYTWEI